MEFYTQTMYLGRFILTTIRSTIITILIFIFISLTMLITRITMLIVADLHVHQNYRNTLTWSTLHIMMPIIILTAMEVRNLAE